MWKAKKYVSVEFLNFNPIFTFLSQFYLFAAKYTQKKCLTNIISYRSFDGKTGWLNRIILKTYVSWSAVFRSNKGPDDSLLVHVLLDVGLLLRLELLLLAKLSTFNKDWELLAKGGNWTESLLLTSLPLELLFLVFLFLLKSLVIAVNLPADLESSCKTIWIVQTNIF